MNSPGCGTGSAGGGGYSGDQGSVILGASAEYARIRLRHGGGIKHGGDHAVGAVLPGVAPVGAQGDPAVVARINPAGRIDDHGMMIAVHVVRRKGLTRAAALTGGDLRPPLAAIFGEVQIDGSADHEIGIGGVHRDAVVIGQLAFMIEVPSADGVPAIAAVVAAKNAQNLVRPTGNERIENIRMGVGNRQADAGAELARRQAVPQMVPGDAEILAAPDPVLRAARLQRDVHGVVFPGMKNNRIAVITANAPGGVGLNAFRPLIHIQGGGLAFVVRNRAQRHAKSPLPILPEGDGADAARKLLVSYGRHDKVRRPG